MGESRGVARGSVFWICIRFGGGVSRYMAIWRLVGKEVSTLTRGHGSEALIDVLPDYNHLID